MGEVQNSCEHCKTLIEYIGDIDENRDQLNYCPVCGRKINEELPEWKQHLENRFEKVI